MMKLIYKSIIAATVCSLAVTGTVLARPGHCDPTFHADKTQAFKKEPRKMGMHHPMKPHYLKGVVLTTAQEDKIFALTHASIPDMRARMKKQHALRQELVMLVQSNQYTESKCRTIAKQLAEIEKAHTIAKSDLDHQIYMLLTDKQKDQVKANHREKPGHGGMIPPKHANQTGFARHV